MSEKEITLKIESSTMGHETKVLPLSQAISECETQTKDNGKWLYIDGKYTNVDIATEEGKQRLAATLSAAKDVVLAGTLLGG